MRGIGHPVLWALGLLAACDTGELTVDTPIGEDPAVTDSDAPAGDTDPTPDDTDVVVDDSDPADTDAEGPAPWTFTVLTINLRTPLSSAFDVEARLDIVANAIGKLDVDVIALQEVTESVLGSNTAEGLAERTGYHHRWAVGSDFLGFKEGPGVLTRWEPVWTEERTLPHKDLANTVDRKVIGVGLPTPHGVVGFYSTHLGLQDDDDQHADQAVAVWELMAERRGELPSFLGGDLNAEDDRKTLRFLTGEVEHGGARGDLVDAWDEVGKGGGRTYPSDRPERRIDYVLAAPGTDFVAEPVQCRVLFGVAVGGTYASDHRGVLCKFQVVPAP